MGSQGAIIETCPLCNVQFSVWMVDPKSSSYQIGILSEEISITGKLTTGTINFQDQAGRETKTTISEWLISGAIYTSNIASCYEKMEAHEKACEACYQSASMYRGLGFIEESEEQLKDLENILPKIDEGIQEKFLHEINRLRKQTSESLRSRDFTFIFISCPSCHNNHQIRASQTTVAIELCSKCQAKFSVYYDDSAQEFYTNILEEPKVKVLSRSDGLERDEVKFCVRCGLNMGIIAQFCTRCGLKILRNQFR